MFNDKTQEFLAAAAESGLLDQLNEEVEMLRNEQRVAVIAELAALPPIEKTNIPQLSKAATAAHRALEVAQESYMQADRDYKSLSMQLYGAQLHHDAARNILEQRARELSPQFMRDAYDDLTVLDAHVQRQFRYEHESVSDGWFGGRRTITTSNGEAMLACRKTISNAQARLMQMMLEATAFEESRVEAATLVHAAMEQAFKLGVSRQEFNDRRTKKDPAVKAEASAHRANVLRSKKISAIAQ